MRYTLAVGDGRRRGGVVVVAVRVGVVPGDGVVARCVVRGEGRGARGMAAVPSRAVVVGTTCVAVLEGAVLCPAGGDATRRRARGTRARTDPSSAGNRLLETRRASTTRSARLAGDAAGAPTRQNMELGEMLNARATHRACARECARDTPRARASTNRQPPSWRDEAPHVRHGSWRPTRGAFRSRDTIARRDRAVRG